MIIKGKMYLSIGDLRDLIEYYADNSSTRLPLPSDKAVLELLGVGPGGEMCVAFDVSDEGPIC